MVSSEDIDGETVCPFAGASVRAGDGGSSTLGGIIMEGSIAVTIVELAAPPMLKNSLAKRSWGNTLCA